MAHFAKVNSNNVVENVIVVSNDDCNNLEFPESELVGKDYLASLGLEGNYLQSSINNNFRLRFAQIGGMYIASADIFTVRKPYNSWVLDENHEWQAPTPKPLLDGVWVWDESSLQWVR